MMKRLFSLSVAVAAVALTSAAAGAQTPGPVVNAPAPAFSLKTLDGKTVTNRSLLGKTVVLNVWATWCPPCREETADFLKAYATLKHPDVVFLGVDTTEAAPLVRAFVAAKNIPYAQAIGGPAFSEAYAIANYPTTFVIDPHGILRVRYISGATDKQVISFVQAAKAGREIALTSPLQTKLNALLDDPSIAFNGPPASIAANAQRAYDAISKVEDVADNSDSTNDLVDFVGTQAKENALRDRAIAAFAPVVSSDKDKVLLALLRGDAARANNRWSEALTEYQAALAIDPKQEDALDGAVFATSRLKQYDLAASYAERIVALEPESVSARIELARALANAKSFDRAYTVALEATALAQKHVDAKPADPHAIVLLAWSHLYAGRIYAQGGETAKARAEFDATQTAARLLPPSNNRYGMYIEESQEATVALGLSAAHPATQISLAPWTGADLPGSLQSTIKYRLAVAGSPGATVNLATKGLPKGWVASFCTDRLCAPFRVQLALPASGVKVIEFQLIPDEPGSPEPRITIEATDGASTVKASNIALVR